MEDPTPPLQNGSFIKTPILLILIGCLAGVVVGTGVLLALPYRTFSLMLLRSTSEQQQVKELESAQKVGRPVRGLGFDYLDNLKQFPTFLLPHYPALSETLESIEIIGSSISQISDDVALLGNLRKFWLTDSNVTDISQRIGNLQNLTELRLSGNRLKSMPRQVGNLVSLNVLDLSDNQLRALPDEIGNLENLVILDLRKNRLSTLPPSIQNLSKLEYLYLGGNSLSKQKKNALRSLLPKAQIYF